MYEISEISFVMCVCERDELCVRDEVCEMSCV